MYFSEDKTDWENFNIFECERFLILFLIGTTGSFVLIKVSVRTSWNRVSHDRGRRSNVRDDGKIIGFAIVIGIDGLPDVISGTLSSSVVGQRKTIEGDLSSLALQSRRSLSSSQSGSVSSGVFWKGTIYCNK